jgi:hypothetical protein
MKIACPSHYELILFSPMAIILLAGCLGNVIPYPHMGLVLCLPLFLIIAKLLRLPFWAKSLIVALPISGILAVHGLLPICGIIIEWSVFTTITAVLTIFLFHKQLGEIIPSAAFLSAGLVPVFLCGISPLFFAAWHYGWGYGQIAETIRLVLQGGMIVLAATLVCSSTNGRLVMLLILCTIVLTAGL